MSHDYTENCMSMKLGCRRRRSGPSVRSMEPLPFPAYLDHLRTESARFREVLADCDPAARVPACPDWDAADLLWHLATVQAFWAKVVRRDRPRPPGRRRGPAPRPDTYDGLLAAFDEHSAALVERARGGRSRRRGVALVQRPHRRRELPPAGPRGADPPARRRGDRRPGRPTSTRRSPPTGCSRCSRSCTAAARRGARSRRPSGWSTSRSATPATSCTSRSRGSPAPTPTARPTTSPTSPCVDDSGPAARHHHGHGRRPRHLAVAPRRGARRGPPRGRPGGARRAQGDPQPPDQLSLVA